MSQVVLHPNLHPLFTELAGSHLLAMVLGTDEQGESEQAILLPKDPLGGDRSDGADGRIEKQYAYREVDQ